MAQRQALATFETRMGKDHPSTLTVLENRASLGPTRSLSRSGDDLSPGAPGREKLLDPNDPCLATTLSNLAGYKTAAGNEVNVEPLYRRALAIRERASGPRHPEVAVLLNNLAEHLRREGKVRQAEPLYRRALNIQEMRAGIAPGLCNDARSNWAEFLARRNRKKEAE